MYGKAQVKGLYIIKEAKKEKGPLLLLNIKSSIEKQHKASGSSLLPTTKDNINNYIYPHLPI